MEVTATELIKTVTAFNGQKAELETFNGHVDEASSTAIQTLRLHEDRAITAAMQLHKMHKESCDIFLHVFCRKVGIDRCVMPRIGVVAGYATGLVNTVPRTHSMIFQQVSNEDKYNLINLF